MCLILVKLVRPNNTQKSKSIDFLKLIAREFWSNMALIVTCEEASKATAALFGFHDISSIRSLGSCQDANFRLDIIHRENSQTRSYVLKISNSNATLSEVQFQNSVLLSMQSAKSSKLQYPQLVPTTTNELVGRWQIGSESHFVRCLTFVDGIILSECKYLSVGVYEQLGAVIYDVDRILYQVAPPLEESDAQWDMQHSYKNIEKYAAMMIPSNSLNAQQLADMVADAQRMQREIDTYSSSFSKQVLHGDLAYYNLVAQAADVLTSSTRESSSIVYGRPSITGVIDFSDCCYSWLIGELCIAITPLLVTDDHDPLEVTCTVLRGFLSSAKGTSAGEGSDATSPKLNEGEVRALWPLIVQRAIMLNIFVQYQLQLDPGNKYCADEIILNRQLLENISSIQLDYAQAALHQVFLSVTFPHTLSATLPCSQMELRPNEVSIDTIGILPIMHCVHLDTSTTSLLYKECYWREGADNVSLPGVRNDCAFDFAQVLKEIWKQLDNKNEFNVRTGSTPLILDYGVPQFHLTSAPSNVSSRTIPLGMTILVHESNSSEIALSVQSSGRLRLLSMESLMEYYKLTCPTQWTLETSLTVSNVLLLRLDNSNYDILLRANCQFTFELSNSFGDNNFRSAKMLKTEHIPSGWTYIECGKTLLLKDHSPGLKTEFAVHVQVMRRSVMDILLDKSPASTLPPLFCIATEFPTWQSICPDPMSLIQFGNSETSSYTFDGVSLKPVDNIAVSVTKNISEILTTAKQSFISRSHYAAGAQEYYFADTESPPYIERGLKQYLFDVTGRSYLDMVNNVAVVGHSREALTNAVQKQLSLLNTNSRFIYSALGQFCEMIASKLKHVIPNRWSTAGGWTSGTQDPDKHAENSAANDWQVFVVNSGSEAVDLALRLARTVVTERRRCDTNEGTSSNIHIPYTLERHTLCFGGGYHGITTASDEVSTTLNDNPRSLESRPPWIHLLPLPNMFRGLYRSASYGKQVLHSNQAELEEISHKYAGKYLTTFKLIKCLYFC